MKSYSSIIVLGAFLSPKHATAGCVSGSFALDVKAQCSYEALLKSFKTWFAVPGNVPQGCANSAEEELISLLMTSSSNAAAAVQSICSGAFTNYPKVPFSLSTGMDDRFVEEFFKGNGDWNEQVATLFPVYDGVVSAGEPVESMLLRRDAATVGHFYDEEARRSIVGLPNLPNFASCEMNAVYCCWPKDRQAQDGNGNCATPYDSRCVDSDPGDNTDLCFVDHADGAKSTGSKATDGWFTFPFDDGSNQYTAEGPMHCHGFGWAEDANDPSAVYRGNNLFFVSLYDHMYQRGYVKNVPGAPMCACAEQMPTVSRSDCTQINFENQEHDFRFFFTETAVTAKLVDVYIKFAACQGIDEDGKAKANDLWSYMNRLYIENKVSGSKLQALTQKIVGNGNCFVSEARNLNEKNLTRGYKLLDNQWIILRGKDAFDANKFYGKQAFNYLMSSTSASPAILKRACASCYFDQQWLYYKRMTPVPANLDLWQILQFSGREPSNGTVGNLYGVDFKIYGSYEDALDDNNAWSCPGYKYSDGFPGTCAPYGATRSSQNGFFDASWTRPDIAWFMENKGKVLTALPQNEVEVVSRPELGIYTDLVEVNIGTNTIPGEAYVDESGNTIYMTASGADTWGSADHFKFVNKRTRGDVTMVVRVKSMDTYERHSKAGLMIRESMGRGARVFAVYLMGKGTTVGVYRATTDSWMSSFGEQSVASGDVWLKVTKRINQFTAFRSTDGVSWTMVGSPITLFMSSASDLRVGLAVTSTSNSRLIEATFDNFDSTDYFFPSASPSISMAPSRDIPHTTARDIGRSYNRNFPSDVGLQRTKYTIKAAGYDIWGSEDSFSFVNFPVNGDFNMTAKITSLIARDSWTKFGLMVRDSLDPKSKHIMAVFAPNSGTMSHMRPQYGGSTMNYNHLWERRNSTWLRLQREGSVFSTFKSVVGTKLEECVWQLITRFNSTSIVFNTTVPLQVGMAVTAHNATAYATADFDMFQISQ